jgi:hypothetical protein
VAWEWIGWAVSGAVGVGGLIVANNAGTRQKETALAVVAQQTETQVAIAREDRLYRSRLDAYTATLAHFEGFTFWELKINWWSYYDAPAPADLNKVPEPPLSKEGDPPVDLHWTPRVRELLELWTEQMNLVAAKAEAAWRAWRAQVSAGTADLQSFRRAPVVLDLVTASRQMFAARDALRDQMIRELYEQDPGRPARPSQHN